jgi:hypothetical protein
MCVLHQMVVDCTRHARLACVAGMRAAAHVCALQGDCVPLPPPDWMMKTSFPRTLSSISTRVSPPLNLSSRTLAGGMPRWLQIVLCTGQQPQRIASRTATYSVSCGCELPPRTTMLRTIAAVDGGASCAVFPARSVRERESEGARSRVRKTQK